MTKAKRLADAILLCDNVNDLLGVWVDLKPQLGIRYRWDAATLKEVSGKLTTIKDNQGLPIAEPAPSFDLGLRVLGVTFIREDYVSLRDACKAVLLFHDPSPWNVDKMRVWNNLTGGGETTTYILLEAVRRAVEFEP